MEFSISNYYNNPLNYDKEKEKSFVNKKRGNYEVVSIIKENGRTICNLHRSVDHYLRFTNSEDQTIFDLCNESLWRSHYAVLELRNYKKNFDRGWWEGIGKNAPLGKDGWWTDSKYYKPRQFTDEKRKIATELMNRKDDIRMFNLIREMNQKISEHGIKEILLEMMWQTYRINCKHCEYESKINEK